MTRAEVIARHFPEYIGRTCLCRRPIAHVNDWATHLDEAIKEWERENEV